MVIVWNIVSLLVMVLTVIGHPSPSDHGKAFDKKMIKMLGVVNRRIKRLEGIVKDIKKEDESKVSAFRTLKSSKSNKSAKPNKTAESNKTNGSEDSSLGEEKVKSTSKSSIRYAKLC